ncbi:Protein NLRC3 [Gigaspora margarita]|uniref:Protein NLRC3 n=1 Tax=Gigaspora margarita TaxID=4874 RepID=A0A8H4EMM0_GIGMA|nr:Protein NLRC3 [Gigaspora margarita]
MWDQSIFEYFFYENATLTSLCFNNQCNFESRNAFAEILHENNSLTILNLSGNKLGIKGSKALRRLLTKILPYNNHLDFEGIKTIMEVLSKNIV